MKPRGALRTGAIAAALAVVVAGCGVKVYEPGVYKGAHDQLLSEHAKPEHKSVLKERFTKGQADR